MKKTILVILIFLLSCENQNKNTNKNQSISQKKEDRATSKSNQSLLDKKIKFLWRENLYVEELKDTFNTIVLNEKFCQNISDQERAALGFVATFVGSECNWDGDANKDFSNLKCKILSGLNLGYVGSERHLGFLRKWFRFDKNSLKELEYIPIVPYTATVQDTFEEIHLTVKGNKISVFFKVSGVNLREEKSWSWSETDHFLFEKDYINLIKKEMSKVKHEKFSTD